MSALSDDLLKIHSALVDRADEEMDYEGAWSLRFDAGYTAALYDVASHLDTGQNIGALLTKWSDDYRYLLTEDDEDEEED